MVLFSGVGSISLALLKAETKGLGGVVSLGETGVEFGAGVAKQGRPFETFVQSKLPPGTIDLNAIKSNFSTFDHLTPDGIAVSDKTLNTAAKTYSERPASITSTLNRYVDDMVDFTRDGKAGFELVNADIKGKVLQLGIPYGASPEQLGAIAKSMQYAEQNGIQIIVTRLK